MRVLLLRGEPSARARIHAVALTATHPEIELALARQGARGGEVIELEWQLGHRPARVLRVALAEFAPDVVHSYVDSLTVGVTELTAGRIPVVHDIQTEDGEQRAIEEAAALVAPSQTLLEHIAPRLRLPGATCVFPSYPLARELPANHRHMSAEANIDRLVSLYQSLVREPLTGITG